MSSVSMHSANPACRTAIVLLSIVGVALYLFYVVPLSDYKARRAPECDMDKATRIATEAAARAAGE